jgi:hypothetical protein
VIFAVCRAAYHQIDDVPVAFSRQAKPDCIFHEKLETGEKVMKKTEKIFVFDRLHTVIKDLPKIRCPARQADRPKLTSAAFFIRFAFNQTRQVRPRTSFRDMRIPKKALIDQRACMNHIHANGAPISAYPGNLK